MGKRGEVRAPGAPVDEGSAEPGLSRGTQSQVSENKETRVPFSPLPIPHKSLHSFPSSLCMGSIVRVVVRITSANVHIAFGSVSVTQSLHVY